MAFAQHQNERCGRQEVLILRCCHFSFSWVPLPHFCLSANVLSLLCLLCLQYEERHFWLLAPCLVSSPPFALLHGDVSWNEFHAKQIESCLPTMHPSHPIPAFGPHVFRDIRPRASFGSELADSLPHPSESDTLTGLGRQLYSWQVVLFLEYHNTTLSGSLPLWIWNTNYHISAASQLQWELSKSVSCDHLLS